LKDAQADEEAGDEVISGGRQARAAAFQFSDACQQAAVEDLVNAMRYLFSEGAFKAAAEAAETPVVQEKGEALRRGCRFQEFAQGTEVEPEAAQIDSF